MVDKDDIIKMANDAGIKGPAPARAGFKMYASPQRLLSFAALVAAAEREKVAAWMIAKGYATGHGDTVEDLLKELEWQIEERIAAEREACAKVCDVLAVHPEYASDITKVAAQAIRARGNT